MDKLKLCFLTPCIRYRNLHDEVPHFVNTENVFQKQILVNKLKLLNYFLRIQADLSNIWKRQEEVKKKKFRGKR